MDANSSSLTRSSYGRRAMMGRSSTRLSFTVSFSMTVVYPSSNNKQQQQVGGSGASSLYFGILPASQLPILLAPPSSGSLNSPPTSAATRTVAGRNVSINIRLVDHATASTPLSNNGGTFAIVSNAVFIEISIQPPSGEMSSNYTVWIDYERDRKQLSVYAIDAGKPKPDSPIVNISRAISNMTRTSPLFGTSFGLFSSLDQLLQIHTWESTVEVLPSLDQSRGMSTIGIVAVAVGPSLAIAAAVATIVYCYFNSKYRTWKKDLDQLAKSMQSLPGVPIQINFRDIQKATNNFHETTKLGRGGFGAVYRCRLPATIKGGGEALDVAVKKFTRDDNRRYEDFLAEVSIINQLRHKNIVPLIGWSYNKGEPILVYEYMPNGSLDQHLFGKSGDRQQRSPICQWETRYNIVMDVATGLQYVHHEYEPMVLHRDIKASNIMIDSAFRRRLGDFGLACTVDMERNSYTERGDRSLAGTYGFIPYDYIHSGSATRKTDTIAFGVLILETVTGKPALGNLQLDHITDWVWHLHRQGKLLDAVDPVLTTDQQFDSNNAKRLLLLGLACSSPNPSERPSMMEALQVITKLAPPSGVPLEKPRFVLPPEEECNPISADYSRTTNSNLERSSTTVVEMATRRHVSFQSFENAGNSFHHRPVIGHS